MKKIAVIIILLIIVSCGKDKRMNSEEGVVEIQKIIDENFDSESEVYDFSLHANDLSSSLDFILRVYKVKGVYFKDTFRRGGFTDPVKQISGWALKKKKPFKIGDIDVSIIPSKYSEAIDILKENNLFKAVSYTHLTLPTTPYV